MTKRWNVHHGNENLGLKTAKEIREALRKGTLDPFDKVSAEGSNIREDLIEVDEIFKESSDEDEDVGAGSGSASASTQVLPAASGMGGGGTNIGYRPGTAPGGPGMSGTNPGTTNQYTPNSMNSTATAGTNAGGASAYNTRSGLQPAGNAAPFIPDPNQPRTNPPPNNAGVGGLSWRSDQTPDFKEQVDSKSNQKRYYLIDKSKILGPLSGLEIQSLYNRNVLNQKVKVQRIGSTRSIPVAQFISSYSEDRLKELTDDGKLNQKVSSPSSKVLNELSRVANAQKLAQSRKNKTYTTLVLAGLVLGAILFVIFDATRPSSSNKRSEPREEREAPEARRNTSRPKLLQKNQSEEQADDNEEEDARSRNAAKPTRAQPPKAKKARSEPAERPAKAKAKKTPAREREVASAPAPKPSRPSPAPTPSPAPAPTPAPTPRKAVDREGPIAKAMSGSGSGIKTIGPLSFNMGSLDSCASKCTLIFRDSSGATLKAVFFKSAYYDQLKKSSGSVFLTGNARKEGSEVTIFIQDVR